MSDRSQEVAKALILGEFGKPFELREFPLPEPGGLVVVASMRPEREPPSAIRAKAGELDRRFRTSFSFQAMVRRVGR